MENAVAGDAMRPLDVITTRKGLTVEVGNTDAEGRLILCDALAEADTTVEALRKAVVAEAPSPGPALKFSARSN